MSFKAQHFYLPWFFSTLIALSACSSTDDTTTEEEEDTAYIPVTVYGQVNDKPAVLDISSEGTTQFTNLETEFGLNPDYKYFSVFTFDMLLFYTLDIPTLDLKLRNLATATTTLVPEFCASFEDEIRYGPGTNGDVVYKLAGTENEIDKSLYLEVYDLLEEAPCSRIDVAYSDSASADFTPFDIQTYDNFVLVYYLKAEGGVPEYRVSLVDLAAGEVLNEFTFDDTINKAFIAGNEVFIDSKTNNFNEYDVYDINDFSFKRSITIVSKPFTPTLLTSFTVENKFPSFIALPQPSSFPVAPAITDLENGDILFEMTAEELITFDNKVLTEILPDLVTPADYARSFHDFKVDLKTETIIFAYSTSASTGYVVFADYEGNIKSHVELPLDPKRIIIH
ncbi:hypothetical protein [Maribacter sp. 2-571]|uniref:hypothetical protein n=1 Tax=Maribacter sp. 2-571 TaxID=3417569 RepID=UPI003D33C267